MLPISLLRSSCARQEIIPTHSLLDVGWLLISQRFRRIKVNSQPLMTDGLELGTPPTLLGNLQYYFFIMCGVIWGTIQFTYMIRNLETLKLPCNWPLKIQAPIEFLPGDPKASGKNRCMGCFQLFQGCSDQLLNISPY